MPTTVVDLTGDQPVITRQGKGSVEAFGLPA
jgi:tRNA A37 threonylcarbamoyladenosine synthetase subunit TsaC/SUA5/YrdC